MKTIFGINCSFYHIIVKEQMLHSIINPQTNVCGFILQQKIYLESYCRSIEYQILFKCQPIISQVKWSWRGLLRQILTCLASQDLNSLFLRSSNVKIRSTHFVRSGSWASETRRRTFERSRMELKRIELLTPCLQSRCSPSWATAPA